MPLGYANYFRKVFIKNNLIYMKLAIIPKWCGGVNSGEYGDANQDTNGVHGGPMGSNYFMGGSLVWLRYFTELW